MGKRKQFLIWIAAAVIATGAFLTILLRQRWSGSLRRSSYVIGVPENGAVLFFGKKRCSTCHSINGEGGRVAPDLSGKRPGTPAMGWLTTVLWNHAPGMWRQMRRGAYPKMDTQEMADILAYLYQAGISDAAGDVTTGKLVFEKKGCVRCHSVGSWGGKSAPELSRTAAAGGASAWTRGMWNHAQSMLDPITAELGEWPKFTGDEMNHLIAFASAASPSAVHQPERHGQPERGWSVFQQKCLACHSVGGQGGSLAPALGPEKDIPLSTARFASLLWNHAPDMLRTLRERGLAAPKLEGDEILDLLAFLASLRYFEPSGSPLLGERVFRERGCARCHGTGAEGTRIAPRLRTSADAYTTVSLAAALWSHGPQMRDRAEELGFPWPALASTDVGDLVSFLNAPHKR